MYAMEKIGELWAVTLTQKGRKTFVRWSESFVNDKRIITRANQILESQSVKCKKIEAGRRALRLVGKLKNPESRAKWTKHTIIQFNKLGRAS